MKERKKMKTPAEIPLFFSFCSRIIDRPNQTFVTRVVGRPRGRDGPRNRRAPRVCAAELVGPEEHRAVLQNSLPSSQRTESRGHSSRLSLSR
jgi:hypothetical protein